MAGIANNAVEPSVSAITVLIPPPPLDKINSTQLSRKMYFLYPAMEWQAVL
jgi:hypothetical protein